MERNLEKEMGYHPNTPDTALSGELSSVYCVLDHDQYWLIRNILDHNTGEAIPDFPQPLASLQPPAIQVLYSLLMTLFSIISVVLLIEIYLLHLKLRNILIIKMIKMYG